ncbi:AAA family ATPase [Luteimonas sp. A478]
MNSDQLAGHSATENDEALGRESELDEMTAIWARAKAGEPQWLMILGESGTGKTRLVQEFYRRISMADDPKGYWPDSIRINGQILELNPRPEDFPTADFTADLPWLWWGIRSIDPDRRNSSEARCAFADALEPFTMHMEPLVRKNEARNAALDIAGDALALIPGMALYESFSAIISISKKLGRVAKAGSQVSPRDTASAKFQDLKKLIVDSLMCYLKSQVPVILVLDDCQWLDPESLAIISSLCHELGSQKYKFMVISTSWEREYRSKDGHPLAALLARDMDTGKPMVGAFLGQTHEMSLCGLKEGDAAKIMLRFAPGLASDDITAIHARSGGNVRHIHELCNYLLRKTQHFEGGDPASRLSLRGRRELETKETDLDDLVDLRFSQLSIDIQRALEVSSYQGVQFNTTLTAGAVDELLKAQPNFISKSAPKLLDEAERPGSMVSTVSELSKEFLPGPYWRTVRKSLDASGIEEVEGAYGATVPALLQREVQDLDQNHIDLIEKFAKSTADSALRNQCRAVLMQWLSMSQRYELAFEQLALIANSETLYWPESTLDFAEHGLRVLSRFGVRPPNIPSGLEVQPELWAMLLAPTVYEHVRAHDHSQYGEASTLQKLRLLDMVARTRDAFGHVLHAAHSHMIAADYTVTSLQRLDGKLSEELAATMGNSLVTAMERCAPLFQNDQKIREGLTAWKNAALDVANRSTSEISTRLVRGFTSIVQLQVFPALEGRDADDSEVSALFSRGADDLGEVLASRYKHKPPHGTEGILSIPEGQLMLASATARVVEQAMLVKQVLARDFVDILEPMIDSIEQDARNGKYLTAHLATALLDSVIASADFLRREAGVTRKPVVPSQMAAVFEVFVIEEREVQEDEARVASIKALSIADEYYAQYSGSVEFLVAHSRSLVSVLDHDEAWRSTNALTAFEKILENAKIGKDPERVMLQEPPLFLHWLEVASRFLPSNSYQDAKDAISALYSDADFGDE